MKALDDPSTMPLDFSRPVDPAPVATIDDVEQVFNVLKRASGWMTAAQIAKELGAKFTDRKVRKVASAAAPEIVSFPGSPGYRLFGECTVEEVDHCIATFRSQGREMLKRSMLYSRKYHQRQGTVTQ